MPDRREADLAELAVELERTTEINDQTEQMLEIAAIVEEALAPIGLHPVVVGGLAVAYWTSGAHLTSDIDVVMPHTAEAGVRLEQLGFAREGRFWVLPARGVFLEAPGSRLEPSAEGFETIETRSGRFVRVQSADELLLQRLMEFAGKLVVVPAMSLAPRVERDRPGAARPARSGRRIDDGTRRIANHLRIVRENGAASAVMGAEGPR